VDVQNKRMSWLVLFFFVVVVVFLSLKKVLGFVVRGSYIMSIVLTCNLEIQGNSGGDISMK